MSSLVVTDRCWGRVVGGHFECAQAPCYSGTLHTTESRSFMLCKLSSRPLPLNGCILPLKFETMHVFVFFCNPQSMSHLSYVRPMYVRINNEKEMWSYDVLFHLCFFSFCVCSDHQGTVPRWDEENPFDQEGNCCCFSEEGTVTSPPTLV